MAELLARYGAVAFDTRASTITERFIDASFRLDRDEASRVVDRCIPNTWQSPTAHVRGGETRSAGRARSPSRPRFSARDPGPDRQTRASRGGGQQCAPRRGISRRTRSGDRSARIGLQRARRSAGPRTATSTEMVRLLSRHSRDIWTAVFQRLRRSRARDSGRGSQPRA